MLNERYEPQDLYETDLMRAILATAWRTSPDTVDGIAGVRVVTPHWERPDDEDCTGYVFGSSFEGALLTYEVMDTWKASGTPIPGAIAVYSLGKQPMHVGLVQENGNVISKWKTDVFESGHVYEHLPLAVPRDYGDTVIFYTPQ